MKPSTDRTRTSLRALALALGLAALAACSSTNPYTRPHDQLQQAATSFEANNLRATNDTLDVLLSETNAEHADFARQRFFASLLLARVHMAASYGGAFLFEKGEAASQGIGGIGGIGGDSNRAEPGQRASTTGHLMAGMLHGTNALNWSAAAGKAPREVDGQVLVPASLEAMDVRDAETWLVLSRMVTYGRLRFEDRVKRILDQSPPLLDLKSCEEILDRVGVSGPMRPWTYLLIHRYLRKVDEPQAYRFAVRALATASGSAGSIATKDVEEVSTWITAGSSYVFKCPTCKTPAIPSLGECVNEGTPLLDFYGEAKR